MNTDDVAATATLFDILPVNLPVSEFVFEYREGLCSFARREGYERVISVESEETDWFDIRNPSLHSCYGGEG